ncbi:MAG: alkene reductase [Gammaproteobacteria bacterium]
MISTLLSPFKLSAKIELNNRIIMAPMTRRRALENYCPSEEMAEYYAKRADAGLIVTEGTLISEDAIGYGNVPGIFTEEQINSWKKITAAVHQRGGVIFLQLWHCGRVSHPVFHDGRLPISPSAIAMNIPLGGSGYVCHSSRAATKDEIAGLVNDYANAARNAIEANFDGIELHAANGYLIDQFLHYCSNQRNDEYGATPENMARFCFEVVKACGDEIGFERVGLRLSPGGHLNEIITDERDQLVYQVLLNQLEPLNIAYIHTGTFDDSIIYQALSNRTATSFLRQHYKKIVIASGSYDFASAENGITKNLFDLIALGRPFIANPDLISRLKQNIPLNKYDPEMLKELN